MQSGLGRSEQAEALSVQKGHEREDAKKIAKEDNLKRWNRFGGESNRHMHTCEQDRRRQHEQTSQQWRVGLFAHHGTIRVCADNGQSATIDANARFT